MKPKQAFQVIVTYDVNDSGRTVADYCEEECNIVGKALTELEELKRDVKRYFELEEQAKHGNGIDDIEANEFTRLHIKLSKVGKEE